MAATSNGETGASSSASQASPDVNGASNSLSNGGGSPPKDQTAVPTFTPLLKVKDEPYDWTTATSEPSQSQGCGSVMPCHTSSQPTCPPSHPFPSYPGMPPPNGMNGMNSYYPYGQPPQGMNGQQMQPNYPGMPAIKPEPSDEGYGGNPMPYMPQFPQPPPAHQNHQQMPPHSQHMPPHTQHMAHPHQQMAQNHPQMSQNHQQMPPHNQHMPHPHQQMPQNHQQMPQDHQQMPPIKQEPGTVPPPPIGVQEPPKPAKKPKGRPKKTDVKKEVQVKQEKITDSIPTKKKRDRFKGMTEEEVLKRTLPDHLVPDLDIIIVGINPGLTAAFLGHHYAGPGNHFWKCLYLSGLIPEPMNAYDDYKLKDYGIGFTNIVERTSRGSADLSKKEIKEGGELLLGKILKYKPKIAVFNGKGIYEVFCGHKNFNIGKQPEPFPGSTETLVYVMPSSSARCSQLPRAVDKVPFYLALKRLRDYCRGKVKELDEKDVTFPDLELKVIPKEERLKAEAEEKAKVKEEPGIKIDKRKNRKRKSADQEALENMAMSKLTDAQRMPHPGMSSGAQGMPTPFPPSWTTMRQMPQSMPPIPQMPPMPQTPNMPGPPMSQASPVTDPQAMHNLFASSPHLVKQEDMSELAKFGITQATFSNQAFLGGCPPPQMPTVSQPGAWHGAGPATNSAGYQYSNGQQSMSGQVDNSSPTVNNQAAASYNDNSGQMSSMTPPQQMLTNNSSNTQMTPQQPIQSNDSSNTPQTNSNTQLASPNPLPNTNTQMSNQQISNQQMLTNNPNNCGPMTQQMPMHNDSNSQMSSLPAQQQMPNAMNADGSFNNQSYQNQNFQNQNFMGSQTNQNTFVPNNGPMSPSYSNQGPSPNGPVRHMSPNFNNQGQSPNGPVGPMSPNFNNQGPSPIGSVGPISPSYNNPGPIPPNNAGPMSPNFCPQGQQAYNTQSTNYQYNGSNGPSMGFG